MYFKIYISLHPDDTPNIMGFSLLVNQSMLPPTFPRYTKIKSRDATYKYLEELLHNLKHTCKVINCTNYQIALNFFMEFSKKQSSCLLSRSVLQVLYLPVPNKVFGVTNLTDVLKDSVKAFIAPPVLMPKNSLYSNPQVRLFVCDCKNYFHEILSRHIHNRPKNASIHFSSIMNIHSLCSWKYVDSIVRVNVIKLLDFSIILLHYRTR